MFYCAFVLTYCALNEDTYEKPGDDENNGIGDSYVDGEANNDC